MGVGDASLPRVRHFFFSLILHPPRSTLFPYTTLFRSLHVVHALIPEVRRIVVEAETLVPFHRLDRALGAGGVEGDLGRVHFQTEVDVQLVELVEDRRDRKSTRLNSSHLGISYAVFCLK